MSQSIQGFLKPAYYVPKEDEPLKTSVRMISIKQGSGLKGHSLVIAQAVCSIARAIFINILYYVSVGTRNLFLNGVHLNFEHMVLGHYKAAMQSLVYAVMATIYTTFGIFIPPVLSGFKMALLSEDADTLQEAQEVFKALQGKPYCFIDKAMVEKNWKFYHGKDRDHLFEQINRDLPRLDVCIDKTRYDGTCDKNAQSIFENLIKTDKMAEELALKVMAQIQQGVFVEPCMGLTESFFHNELGLRVLHYPEKGGVINVETTKDCIKIEAQNHLCYKTTDFQKSYFRESPVAIFDTRVLLEIPKDGSACKGHWTWEVVEIPV
ncbi:MAG: hypothetical protein ACRDAI_03355 [Candidatus Rhabdochlamydia sp.]